MYIGERYITIKEEELYACYARRRKFGSRKEENENRVDSDSATGIKKMVFLHLVVSLESMCNCKFQMGIIMRIRVA